MKTNWTRIALGICLTLLLVACSEIVSPALPEGTSSSSTAFPLVVQTQKDPLAALPTQEPDKDGTQMTSPTLPSSGLEFLIEKAKEDLAQRLTIAITEISLVEAKEVVWPDSSLGCPQPGMRYKQVPEDGALIVLEAQGTAYEYHNGGSRGLFLCEKGLSSPKKPPQIDITNLTPQILDNNYSTPSTPDQGIPPGEDQ